MPRRSANPREEAEQENNRGVHFAQDKRRDEAIKCFQRAISIDGDLHAAHVNLGILLADQGRMDEAIAALETAIRLEPDSDRAHNNLANMLTAVGRLDAAVHHCDRSLAIRLDNAEALNALGNALKDQGLLEEAVNAYARAALLRPDLQQPQSNRLYALHFLPAMSAEDLLVAHRDWGERVASQLPPLRLPHPNSREPERRLKIGYVSCDFREHPVGRFILPLLERHDRNVVEVFCYANLRAGDAMTTQIRASCDVWRDIAALADEQVCDAIRSDQIDILIDLTMHLRGHRLTVFARRPAPVQVTYLAYCSTTGLAAIDYRLTDHHLDPLGNEVRYVERSVRLATYWCYRADQTAPDVNTLPALSGGSITFACLNNFCKVSHSTLETWKILLGAIPQSRLILHCGEGSHRERVVKILDVNPNRLKFVGRLPLAQYLALHHQIDIALDPSPYTGGTTTCDALWMGVPVVSLAGETAISRSGLSILSNIERAEWVATASDGYVRIAKGLADDLPRLAAIRASLREQMRRSPLMDEERFARDVESAYQRMWRKWCDDTFRESDHVR